MRWVFFSGKAVLTVVLVCGCFRSLVGQQSAPSNASDSSIIFRSSVNRVVLDVVVTDGQDKPVPGLTAHDFSITEDGAPQRVLSFEAHNLDDDTLLVSKLPPLPPNTFVNIATATERGPLYVLLLDLVNTEADDQAYGRAQLLKFVSGKPEGTRFAVFCLSDGLHLVQGFTSDREKIYDAFDPSSPRAHVPRLFLYGRNFGRGDPMLMISVLTDIAHYLEGLPGRKNLLWVSGEFPVQLFPSDEIGTGNTLPDIRKREIQALDALTRSEAAVYPVNVRGVVTNPEGALTGANPNGGSTSANLAPGQTEPTTGPSDMLKSTQLQGSDSLAYDYAIENEVASLTGGHAFHSTNDLAEALDEATDMGAHYYTLTYSPSNSNYDGTLRAIRVKLDKKGYHIDYRHAYYANAPTSPATPIARFMPGQKEEVRPIGDSLFANMQLGAPVARQVFFRAHVQELGPPARGTPEQMANLAQQPAYFKKGKKDSPAKPLAPVELQTYLVDYTVVSRQPNLEVAAAAYDSEGVMLNGDVEEASGAASSAADSGGSYFRVEQRIDVPLKAKTLRLAVRDVSTDRIGAMEISLPLARESAQGSLPAGSTSAPAKAN